MDYAQVEEKTTTQIAGLIAHARYATGSARAEALAEATAVILGYVDRVRAAGWRFERDVDREVFVRAMKIQCDELAHLGGWSTSIPFVLDELDLRGGGN